MSKVKLNNIIMRSDVGLGVKVLGIVLNVIAFVALYLLVMSAPATSAARLSAVVVGGVLIAGCLVFDKYKYAVWLALGVVAICTVLSVALGTEEFVIGAKLFVNDIATTINSTMQKGYALYDVVQSGGAEFLFASVVSLWLAIVTYAALKKIFVYILIAFVAMISLLISGLYPAAYSVVFIIATCIGLLAVERGLTFKSAILCLVSGIVVTAVVIPSMLYGGSAFVTGIREGIADTVENIIYGSDSLPEGDLAKSGELHDSSTQRLKVTVSSQTATLYLKGFVGSDLSGNKWLETNKNKYVENGYSGLLEYVSDANIPLMQFAQYSNVSNVLNTYNLTVENIGANSKYVYMPYTASAYSAGSAYYDLNLRDGIRPADKYTFSVFSGDRMFERLMQDDWIVNETKSSQQAADYIDREKPYRAFVHDVYSAVDEGTAAAASNALGETTTSINTATQLIRTYFLGSYSYSDSPDAISGSFLDGFFSKKISNANAPYFATAAVYMYRTLGFAARYAEGYFVNAEDIFAESDGLDECTVSLTDKDAHAWVEVYFDGIGWLPIEVTPGYFREQAPDTTVEPENPQSPDNDPTPTAPDTEEPEPVGPGEEKPDPTPAKRGGTQTDKLYDVLRVLLPIMIALLIVAFAVFVVVARRAYVISHKRKSLKNVGTAFGRAAYSIVEHDVGACSVEALGRIGISAARTKRFIQLIEKSVYGDCELTVNEYGFVMRFIDDVSNRVSSQGGKLNSLYCKYIKCVGV